MVPEKSDSLLHNYPINDLSSKLKISVLCVCTGNKVSKSSECFKKYIICKPMYYKRVCEHKDGLNAINNNNSIFLLTR